MSIELTTMDSNQNSLNHFEQLTEFLKTHMQDIRIKEQHGDQITYVIIDDAAHTKIFPRMLMGLDENKSKYHIKSYGLSNSSLEQVFLRVADEVKRPEDYERLSCWKKFSQRIKRCCGKKVEETHDETNEEEEEEEENNNDEEQFNSCLSGKIKNNFYLQIFLYFR